MKVLLFTLFSFCGLIAPLKFYSQELNIQETLDYINEKLNIDGNKREFEKNYSYEWSVTKDGKLLIKRFINKQLWSETSVYLKQLDTNYVEMYPSLIKIYSKDNKAITDRFLKDGNSEEKIVHSTMLNVTLNSDEVLIKQIKKAIDHLIILSKNNKAFKTKDPFDE